MAYFPNGTSGDIFEEENCDRCVHQNHDIKSPCCPVWELHMHWNYGQNDDKEKNFALEMFIPMEGLFPKKCLMFFEKG